MTAMSTRTTRAYVLTGPGEGEVQEVAAPVAALGEVVVDVERVGRRVRYRRGVLHR
jgi:hypothetical protein